MELAKRICFYIENLPIIDTHEHIISEKERQHLELDVFHFFSHYAGSDLISAGMTWEEFDFIFSKENDFKKKFEIFMKYWPLIKNTCYSKSILLIFKELFGIERIDYTTISELSNAITESNHSGWYQSILQKSKIEKVIVDVGTTEVDSNYFVPAIRFDEFIMINKYNDILGLEEKYNISINSFHDLCLALEKRFEYSVGKGMVAVKSAIAYCRTLDFSKPTFIEAETIFNSISANKGNSFNWENAKPLQDYMMHKVIQLSIEHDKPIQIHTGFQEPTVTKTGNKIQYTNPLLLTNLFLEYPEAKFVLFHGGYPYLHEWAILGKNFRNVYLDMCWLYIISQKIATNILHILLELVPFNKIFGFGGDYLFIEGAFAHSYIARKVISNVLADKVREEYISEEDAIDIGEAILRKNAKILYKL